MSEVNAIKKQDLPAVAKHREMIRSIFIDYLPMAITAGCIIGFGIYKQTPFIKMLPLLISLIIMLLTAHVSRFALLVGALNCLLYVIGFLMNRIYASVASTLLFDFPFQLVSFFMWKKNSNKQELQVKRLDGKKWGILVIMMVALWMIFYFVYKAFGTASLILDNTLFVFSFTKYCLMLARYLENNIFTIFGGVISLAINIELTIANPENIVYVISAIYTIYMVARSLVNWVKLYKKQNKSRSEKN